MLKAILRTHGPLVAIFFASSVVLSGAQSAPLQPATQLHSHRHLIWGGLESSTMALHPMVYLLRGGTRIENEAGGRRDQPPDLRK